MKHLLYASFSILAVISGCSSVMMISGCASTPSAHASNPKVIMAAITATPVGAPKPYVDGGAPGGSGSGGGSGPALAGVSAGPVAVQAANRGIPVYVAPKIVATILEPYENEKGQLFGPQVMYEKVEEGHMNVDALQHPELAYIPTENLIVPPGMGNPVSAPAMTRAAQEAPRLESDAIDPRDIIVCGLLAKENNRAEAERMAGSSGRRAVFDPDLGWILVPASSK